MQDFVSTSTFQAGVLSFLVTLKTSKQELLDLKKMFLSLDKNSDGQLQIDEIKQGLDKFKGIFRAGSDNYISVMQTLDADGNGLVDYEEFITAAVDKITLLSSVNLKTAFKIIDKDNSGKITIDELQSAFDTQGNKKEESLYEEIIKEVDKNGDGQIDLQEFIDAMTDMLKKEVKEGVVV